VTIGFVEVAGSVFAKSMERSISHHVTCDDLAGKCALELVRLPSKDSHGSTSGPVFVEHGVESGAEFFRARKL